MKVSRKMDKALSLAAIMFESVFFIIVGFYFAEMMQLNSYAIGFCFGLIFHPAIRVLAEIIKEEMKK